MGAPMISVVMPVYNGEKYLGVAIESILNQTYANFEFIIVNDGSQDGTEIIILSYNDERIVYLKSETNLRIEGTLNKGMRHAVGKYIARMDADDISLPSRLEKQLLFMERNPNIGVCGTWANIFGDNIESHTWKCPTQSENIKIEMMFACPFVHPSVFIKRTLFNSYSYSDEFQKAEDYYLWYQLKGDVVFL